MQKQLAKTPLQLCGRAGTCPCERLTARKNGDGSRVGEPSHFVCKLADAAIRATLSTYYENI